jgi:hypothetical protein
MNKHLFRKILHGLFVLLVPLTLVLVLFVGHVAANLGNSSTGSYDLTWFTVAGGGAASSEGGSYSLGGTIGQPATGQVDGGSYSLTGGFWVGSAQFYKLLLPLILR